MAGREEQKRRKAAIERTKRTAPIVGLSEMLRIIRYGREGDVPRLVAYANLLADKVEAAGETRSADWIRSHAQGRYGSVVVLMKREVLAQDETRG